MITETRNMQGTIKPFDIENHKINDKKGRDAFRKFLNNCHQNGNRTIDNPNIYGIDLLTLNQDDVVVKAWEIEVREWNWQGDIPFPFPTMNCLERKEYMWRRDQEFYDKIPFSVDSKCEVLYVQLNNLCNRAVIVPGTMILRHRLKPMQSHKNTGEYIRQVPVERTMCVKLT